MKIPNIHIKPFLDNKLSIFEKYGAFKCQHVVYILLALTVSLFLTFIFNPVILYCAAHLRSAICG